MSETTVSGLQFCRFVEYLQKWALPDNARTLLNFEDWCILKTKKEKSVLYVNPALVHD